MKKFFTFILAVLFAVPVFAGTVSDINKTAYINHIDEMQALRRQILKLTVKEDKTPQEEAALKRLSEVFEEKSQNWQNYLERVADKGTEAELPTPVIKKPSRHHMGDMNAERMECEMKAKMGEMGMPKKTGHKHVCVTCGKDFATIRKERKAKKAAKMHMHCMPMMKPCMCNMPKGAPMPPMMPPAPNCKDGKPMMPPCGKDFKAPKACDKCKELNAGKICDKCKGMKLDICDDCKGVKAPNFCDKCKANMTSPVPPMPLMPPMRPCVCNMPKGAHMHPMMPPAHFCKDGKGFDHKAICGKCCGDECGKCCKDDCKACCGKKAMEAMKKAAHKMACMSCCKDECAKCCKDNCKDCCDKKAMKGCKEGKVCCDKAMKGCKDCKEGKACKADKACKKYADPNMAKENCCKAK